MLVNNSIITLSPNSLPAATFEVSYNQTITASGGSAPYTYAVTADTLPPGLSLNSSTGMISGTPTNTNDGPYNFTVTATDVDKLTGFQDYLIVVNGTLVLSPDTLPPAIVGILYDQPITVSGTTDLYSCFISAGSFPPGMSINQLGLCVISGFPTTDGTYNFTVRALTETNTGSHDYSISVSG